MYDSAAEDVKQKGKHDTKHKIEKDKLHNIQRQDISNRLNRRKNIIKLLSFLGILLTIIAILTDIRDNPASRFNEYSWIPGAKERKQLYLQLLQNKTHHAAETIKYEANKAAYKTKKEYEGTKEYIKQKADDIQNKYANVKNNIKKATEEKYNDAKDKAKKYTESSGERTQRTKDNLKQETDNVQMKYNNGKTNIEKVAEDKYEDIKDQAKKYAENPVKETMETKDTIKDRIFGIRKRFLNEKDWFLNPFGAVFVIALYYFIAKNESYKWALASFGVLGVLTVYFEYRAFLFSKEWPGMALILLFYTIINCSMFYVNRDTRRIYKEASKETRKPKEKST